MSEFGVLRIEHPFWAQKQIMRGFSDDNVWYFVFREKRYSNQRIKKEKREADQLKLFVVIF